MSLIAETSSQAVMFSHKVNILRTKAKLYHPHPQHTHTEQVIVFLSSGLGYDYVSDIHVQYYVPKLWPSMLSSYQKYCKFGCLIAYELANVMQHFGL